MDVAVKREVTEDATPSAGASLPQQRQPFHSVPVIDLSSSDSEDDGSPSKRRKVEPRAAAQLPMGFLDPLPFVDAATRPLHRPRLFWKAGEFDSPADSVSLPSVGGLDHVRVHPKFLHSNATSHKWALGAFAELIDNAMDEVRNGATFVKIDVLPNKKDMSKMLLVEDNGGGMDPEKMRQCMSLGYSAKSKLANTIGQYGNGFKTSTMRLGADVIVFSRHCGKDGKCATQSVGLLSYTFLTKTGKEDIVVPMLDFEKRGSNWTMMVRSSVVDWNLNLETILSWSPYSSEAVLLQEFDSFAEQGTRIIIYNLWDDEDGRLELDFNADLHDIQLGGVNRDEKKIQMAAEYPNSHHFLTYKHSLRSYASILYLRIPENFKIILRGKEIRHHNIVNDMMLSQEVTYKPQIVSEVVAKDPNLVAVVTIGFVKDAKHHIDVQGFNVYHRNRLIKPFWRLWNAAGSDGRGVIGVLEANFVEPAHDKQGFERTTVLSRLELRLVQMQKHYWTSNCHRIGYAPRKNKKLVGSNDRDSSPEDHERVLGQSSRRNVIMNGASPDRISNDSNLISNVGKFNQFSKARYKGEEVSPASEKFGTRTKASFRQQSKLYLDSGSDSEAEHSLTNKRQTDSNALKLICANVSPCKVNESSALSFVPPPPFATGDTTKADDANRKIENIPELVSKAATVSMNVTAIESTHFDMPSLQKLKDENCELKDRLKKVKESLLCDLEQEKNRCRLLTEKLEETEKKLDEANREQEALIDIFSDERTRRNKEEETLRNKLKDAALTIQELLHKLANKSGA